MIERFAIKYAIVRQCRIKGVVGLGLNFYLGLFLYPILVPTCAYYRETI